MTKAASLTIGLVVLCGTIVVGVAQDTPTDLAIKTAAQRTHDTMLLQKKIQEAKAAESRRDLPAAAKHYEDAYKLVESIGDASIPTEKAATIAGLTGVELEMARAAQKAGD